MGNGLWFTGCDAGCRLRTEPWLTRCAGIADLLPFFMFYKSDGFFPEDINLIRTDFQRPGRADFHTFTASIALVCIDSDIPVAGPILKPIIGNHIIFAGGWRLEAAGKIFCLRPQTSNFY